MRLGRADGGVGAARTGAAPNRARRRRAARIAGAALGLSTIAAAWLLVAPPALGGRTTLVTVDGTSMLPRFERSDLVALRPAATYRVGDIVGYRSAMLGRVVLHRIVAVEGGRYVFKGDNNDFVDPERPTRAELVGSARLQVPGGGEVITWLHAPWVVALLAGLLVLWLGLGGRPEPAAARP